MVSDQAPEYPCYWGTALMSGPQPWSCPGQLMHPANSLPLSSNPHCCCCPPVREWRKALGLSSNPQEPAGIWQGRAWTQHRPSLPAPCSAFTLLFCFRPLHLSCLCVPHEAAMWRKTQDCQSRTILVLPGSGLWSTLMLQNSWRVCKYFPKRSTAFLYPNTLSHT